MEVRRTEIHVITVTVLPSRLGVDVEMMLILETNVGSLQRGREEAQVLDKCPNGVGTTKRYGRRSHELMGDLICANREKTEAKFSWSAYSCLSTASGGWPSIR